MTNVEGACPNCGMRRRAEWFRCPRCREILPEVSAPSTGDAAIKKPTRRLWVFAAAASAVIGVVAAILLVTGGAATAPAGVHSQAAGGLLPPGQFAPASRARAVDPAAPSPYSSAAARRTGDAAYAQGDLARARAEYEAAVAGNPNDAEARNNLAQVLMRLNLPSLALLHLDEAVRINSQKWAYRFNRARAYGDSNRLAEATKEYEAAAALFPEDYATQYNLGLTRMKSTQYAEAVTALEQAVKLAPGEPGFLITLGTAYVGVKQPDRARATFEQFLEQAPDDPDVPRVKDLLTALDTARPQPKN